MRRKKGSGDSAWPTARAEDSESAGMRHSRGVADTLTAVTANWPTATSTDANGGAQLRPGRSEDLGQCGADAERPGAQLADADGGDTSPESQQPSGQQRFQPQGGGVGAKSLGHAGADADARGLDSGSAFRLTQIIKVGCRTKAS